MSSCPDDFNGVCMKGVQEIERRALISEGQKGTYINKLKGLGAEALGITQISDTYFCPQYFKSYEDIAMKEVGSYGLRLREEANKDGTERTLNLKVITTKGDHSSWEEHEVNVEDVDEMAVILKTIGFKQFFSYRKVRTSFKLGRMKVLFDDIKDFGLGIEVEILSTKAKEEEAMSEIEKFFEELGIRKNNIIPKNSTITAILMKQKSRF
jgi:predicted adenylyl cyclase CyaB